MKASSTRSSSCSIELVVVDADGKPHRFDLRDADAPYTSWRARGRVVVADRHGRAVLITRERGWEDNALAELALACAIPEGSTRGVPPLRDDGVEMRDRTPRLLVPIVPLGPFMVGPFVLRSLYEMGWVPGPILLWGSIFCAIAIVVLGVALVASMRGLQVQRFATRPGSLTIFHERGEIAAELSVAGASRLVVQRPVAPPLALAVPGRITAENEDGTVVGGPVEVGTHAGRLLEAARELDLAVELRPLEKPPRKRAFALVPFPRWGTFKVSVTDGELRIEDRRGQVSSLRLREGDDAPAVIVLMYRGVRYLEAAVARVALLDRRGRAIFDIPLEWWDGEEGAEYELYALARALDVPVELRGTRARRRPALAGRHPVHPPGPHVVLDRRPRSAPRHSSRSHGRGCGC